MYLYTVPLHVVYKFITFKAFAVHTCGKSTKRQQLSFSAPLIYFQRPVRWSLNVLAVRGWSWVGDRRDGESRSLGVGGRIWTEAERSLAHLNHWLRFLTAAFTQLLPDGQPYKTEPLHQGLGEGKRKA